jgi:5-methylcytosine-specific restriction endonuclease McrA
MKRNKEKCNICEKEISLSNFQKHIEVCSKNLEKSKNNLGKGKGWIKIDPKKRSERAKKAALARSAQFKKERELRLNILPWNELKKSEHRERIDLEQNGKCSICSIDKEWNGMPLKFELDHVNGDRTNESRENLRLVCPNCHSQTETYKIGNNKQPGFTTYSDEQIIKALKENTSGYSAMKSLGMNPHGGNYVRVRRIIKDYNLELDYTV